jgi:hypothetical protein
VFICLDLPSAPPRLCGNRLYAFTSNPDPYHPYHP